MCPCGICYRRAVVLGLRSLIGFLVVHNSALFATGEIRELFAAPWSSTRVANTRPNCPLALPRRRRGFSFALDAERTELQAEDGAAQAEADVFAAFVGLYRALGGIQ